MTRLFALLVALLGLATVIRLRRGPVKSERERWQEDWERIEL